MWIFLNPELFLSEYSFLLLASGEFGNQSGIFLNQPSRLEKNKSAANVWKSESGYFRIQYGGTTCAPSFCRVNPDTIGCMSTGDFHFNTMRVDGEMSQSGKKKLRIHKYPDTRGRGLRIRTILPLPLLDYTTAIYFCNKTNIYGSYIITLSGIVAHFSD